MFAFLKKRSGASCGMRVVIALIYGLVNITVLLNHTCCSIKEDLHSCHLDDSNCHFAEDSCDVIHLKIDFNQRSSNGKVLSYRDSCPACLYLLISKLYKLNQAIPQVSGENVVIVRFIYHLNFTKQFEWLSSGPLRAPPIVTS